VSAIRVLLADDHPVFRSGMRAILEGEPETEVIGEAATADEVIALATQLRPDVIVMDLHMPGGGGIKATQQIVAQGLSRVLVVSMLEDDATVRDAIRAGATGYLLKGAGGTEMLRALRAVANGETILGVSIAPKVIGGRANSRDAALPFALAGREPEVLELVARGLTNDAIARQLFLSSKTPRACA